MQTTVVYEKLAKAWLEGKRHIWVEGGTAASKTYSIIQLLVLIAQSAKAPFLISIVSETIPHLKRGAIRDFMNIMDTAWNENNWNATDHIYRFGNGTIEFICADEPRKMKGGRRDLLFVNEANNIVYDSFRELDARTRLCSIADWNPTSSFWYHENRLGDSEDSQFIHCTYLDALNVIPETVVKNILEMGERDPNWNNVYILGLLGKIEGLVYPHFEMCDCLPEGTVIYGLDFGYSNDPTVLIKNVIRDGVLFSQEMLYETNLTNQAISKRMNDLGVKRGEEIFADCSEPKSIQEISELGWNIKPCPKGADSVEFGHQKVRQLKQFWTKDSLRAIKEQRNFRYLIDPAGKFTEKTTHHWSHAMDARRYAVIGHALEYEVSIRWI